MASSRRTRASTAAGRRRASHRSGASTGSTRKAAPAAKQGSKRGPRPSAGRKPQRARASVEARPGRAPKSPKAPGRRTPRPASRSRAPKAGRTARRARASKRTRTTRAPRRPAVAAPSRGVVRLVAVCLAIVALGSAYFFWFRHSSFVAVEEVQVAGISGPGREDVVAELTRVAQGMSTLDFDHDAIDAAARRFAIIAGVEADPNFPHGVRIEVAPRRPVLLATVSQGGALVPVAGDGVVLWGLEIPEKRRLPVLDLKSAVADGATRVEGEPLAYARVLGAAPGPLLPLVREIGKSREHGIELTLKGGITLRFGEADGAPSKWAAAAAVLADPELESAEYVDVRVPTRPVAGGGTTLE